MPPEENAYAFAPTAAPSVPPSRAELGRTLARSKVLPAPRSSRAVAPYEPAGEERYQVVRALGEGAMGEVVLVRDSDIGRRVAVKRMKSGGVDDEAAVLRFAEEVRTIGELEHPGIVPVHDVGIDDAGQHYLVMKYVEGETLESVIAKLRAGDAAALARFPHVARLRIFSALLQTIHYAHERGVLHRDLKPANIMIGPYGEVTIMDWGIAKRIVRGARDPQRLAVADTADAEIPSGRLLATADGVILGTPLYMSPEQALGRVNELDERSDLYSLALIFVELMTLEHPFADKRTTQELVVAHATQVISKTELDARFQKAVAPIEYCPFLARCLAKDPAQRYASAAEMELAFDRVQTCEMDVTCHITFAKRALRATANWLDAHPKHFTVGLLLAIFGLVGGVAMGAMAAAHALR
jgi:serine/threonine protein kinase